MTTIRLKDGRTLAFTEHGDPQAIPTMLFSHLGSRIVPAMQHRQVADAGVRAIVPDRPGIGLSSYDPGRKVLDWADDVAELADHLGLERFALWGYGVGAKYLFACAHQLPDRVLAIACVDGIPPLDDIRAFDGMAPGMRAMYESAKDGPGSDAAQIEMLANMARNDPATVASMLFQFPDALDIDGYDKAEMIEWIRMVVPDVCGNGIGHSHDNWLMLQPWGFALGEIRVPTWLWAANTNSPYPVRRHAELLAEKLPPATFTIWDDERTSLGWLTRGSQVLKQLASAASARSELAG